MFMEDSERYAIQLDDHGKTKLVALKEKHISILGQKYAAKKYVQQFTRNLQVGGECWFALNYPFPPEDAILDWLKTDEAQYFLDDFYPNDADEIWYEHEIIEKWYLKVSEASRTHNYDGLYTIQKDFKVQLLGKVGSRGLVQNLRIVEGLSHSDAFFGSRLATECSSVYMSMLGPEELWFEDKESHLDTFAHVNWVAHHPYPTRITVSAWLESFDAAHFARMLRDSAKYYDHDGMRLIYEARESSVAKAVARRIFNNGGIQAMRTNWYVLSAICDLRIPAFFGKRAKRGPRLNLLTVSYLNCWWMGIGGWAP
eukprot:GEMP01054229.1.p1 GENE.GEMP01054229.1~~GEMP01054229.1.p1  ORF type:complete len:312 (+),score=42.23 GEMP01054229.1:183-1118(+)